MCRATCLPTVPGVAWLSGSVRCSPRTVHQTSPDDTGAEVDRSLPTSALLYHQLSIRDREDMDDEGLLGMVSLFIVVLVILTILEIEGYINLF